MAGAGCLGPHQRGDGADSVAMVTAIVFGIRYLMACNRSHRKPAANIADNSESLLTERFARGGIDETNIAVVWPFTQAPLIIIWPTDINPPSSTSHRYGDFHEGLNSDSRGGDGARCVVLVVVRRYRMRRSRHRQMPATESARFGGSVWVAEEGDNSLDGPRRGQECGGHDLTGLAGHA